MTLYTIKLNNSYFFRSIVKTLDEKTHCVVSKIETCTDLEDAYLISSREDVCNRAAELEEQFNAKCVVESYSVKLTEIIKSY